MWKSCFWHGLLVSAQNLSSEWVISSHGPGTRSEPSDKSQLMNKRRSHGGGGKKTMCCQGVTLRSLTSTTSRWLMRATPCDMKTNTLHTEEPWTTKQCKCKRKLLCGEFMTMLEEFDTSTSQVRQYKGSQDNPNASPLRPSIEIKLCRMQQWQIICCRRMALRSLSVSIQGGEAPRYLLSTTYLFVCLSQFVNQ